MSESVKRQMDGMFTIEDPWKFKTAPMEVERYQRMLDMLPTKEYKWMLDVGCAEGVFTSKLYEKFKPFGLIGVDISANAVRRATENFYKKHNHRIFFYQLDIEEEEVRGRFDVIYLVEVLYLIQPENVERVIKTLVENMTVGGYLIVSNNWIRDWHGIHGVKCNKIIEKYLVKEEEIKFSHRWADPQNHPKDYPVHYYSMMRFRKK